MTLNFQIVIIKNMRNKKKSMSIVRHLNTISFYTVLILFIISIIYVFLYFSQIRKIMIKDSLNTTDYYMSEFKNKLNGNNIKEIEDFSKKFISYYKDFSVLIYNKDKDLVSDIGNLSKINDMILLKRKRVDNFYIEIYRDYNKYSKFYLKIIFYIILINMIFFILLFYLHTKYNRKIKNDIQKLLDFLKESSDSHKIIDTQELNIKEIIDINRKIKNNANTLKKLKQELKVKENLAIVGNFTASIIHDIRNPLTSILGYSELIEGYLPENKKRFLDGIYKAIKRTERLLNDILMFLREKDIKLEVGFYNFRELVDLIKSDLVYYLKESEVSLEVEINSESEVYFDLFRLSRAIVNIIKNAINVSKKGSKIMLIINEKQEFFEIIIRDFGSGISDEIVDTIFEPFVTKGRNRGTGLGLYISKSIVEAHGGEISFVTGAEGTTFIIKLMKKEDVNEKI